MAHVYLQDQDFTLWLGDATAALRQMPAESVHCCVTSPPYFALRDYGVAGQLGLEENPVAYVTALVAVFQEVRRVLRRDGTLWLNLGDSYARGRTGRDDNGVSNQGRDAGWKQHPEIGSADRSVAAGLKDKDLVGIPWRVAFALQADGWYLRSDIIWAKPNPMPESVTDRPTKAHEYLFLLTKAARYFYDADAIREANETSISRPSYADSLSRNKHHSEVFGSGQQSRSLRGGGDNGYVNPAGRNRRSVWEIATEPFSGWNETVRRRRVEADAPDGGKKRTTSPDCPVHGDHPALAPTASDGEREADASSHISRTDAGRARAPLDELVPTAPRREPDSAPESSDSLAPADALTATPRSTGSRKTPSRSAPGDTAVAETPGRTADTSPSSASPAPDDSGSPGSSRTGDHTRCTCAWYVEYTDKTSHFATFPQALVEPCVLAGTSERGCCPVCGAPWVRETGRDVQPQAYEDRKYDRADPKFATKRNMGARYQAQLDANPMRTLGWSPSCDHDREPIPCTVLDPFIGSGTTALVARKLGRRSVGIELNPEYARLAAKRLSQLSLLAEPA